MMKFFTVLMALAIIGSLISMNYFISEPAEACICAIGLGFLFAAIPGGLIMFMAGVSGFLFGLCIDFFLLPVYIVVIIIAAIILLVLGIAAVLIILGIAALLILLSIAAVPILLSIAAFPILMSIVSIPILLSIAAFPILLSIVTISIIFIIGFILQLLGVPVFSILFSLLQVGGHLILIPLSFLRPMVNGISNFIQSIGKIETSSKIESSGVVL